jgi:hypothetical protein
LETREIFECSSAYGVRSTEKLFRLNFEMLACAIAGDGKCRDKSEHNNQEKGSEETGIGMMEGWSDGTHGTPPLQML